MIIFYILKGKRVYKATEKEWIDFNREVDLGLKSKQVAFDTVVPGVDVSTVFLGIDHNIRYREGDKRHTPIVFETMVFGGPLDLYCQRHATYTQAELGHKRMVEEVRKAVKEINPN